MSSNMNFNANSKISTEQISVRINESTIARTLKHIAAPVFDFFTKEESQEDANPFIDYDQEIEKYEMKSATIQNILNDSDPTARKNINIVI